MHYVDVPRPIMHQETDPHTGERRPGRNALPRFDYERVLPYWKIKPITVPYGQFEVVAMINRIWKGLFSQYNACDETYMRRPTDTELYDL